MPSPFAFGAILLAVASGASGGDSLDVKRFDWLMEHAVALRSQQQRHADLALPFIREAVESAEAAHDERREAKARFELGAALISTHNYEGARATLLRTLELSRRWGDFATENNALVSLGSMDIEIGDYDEAVANYRRMLDLATSRGDAATRVRALNSLSATADRSGRGADGVRYGRMALQELDDGVRKGIKFIPAAFFSVPYNLGKGLSVEGDYLDASRYYDRARAAAEKDGSMGGVWHVMHETGDMYLMQGDLPTAERYFERALDIAQKIESRDPEAMTRRALGSLAEQRGDLPAALSHYKTALEMFEKANFRSEIPSTLTALSRVQFLSGYKPEAAITLRRAETLAKLMNQPLALVRVKIESGNQKLNDGDADGATSEFGVALSFARSGGIRSLASSALLGLAQAARAEGKSEPALAFFAQGADSIDAVRASIPSADERSLFVTATHQTYEQWMDTLLESAHGADAERALEQAFFVLERERSRNLFDALRSGRLVRARGQSSAQRQAEQRLGEEVSMLQIQLGSSALPAARRQLLVQRLDDSEQKFAILDASNGPTSVLPALQRVETMRKCLAEDEAFIEYAVRRGQITTFLVTRGVFRVFSRPVEDLKGRILLFTDLLSGPDSEEAIRPGLALSATLLGDALPFLDRGGIHRIFVSVAGDLAALPFDALPDPTNRSRPILERYEIAYTTSLLALAEIRSHPGPRPPYDLLALAPFSDGNASAWPVQRAELRALPSSGEEVNRITRLMAGHVEAMTGKAATARAFKEEPLRDYKVIHLATHALLDPQVPSRSAIVFAQGSTPEGGWLRSREISSLDLAGQLVVLSACQSAAGTTSSAEGMHSLARAFTYAGARTVVGALWKVEDASAAAIVEDMYKSIATGQSVSGALREAQLRMAGDHPYRNSRRWAGWIAAGDPAAKLELEPRRSRTWPSLAFAIAVVVVAILARKKFLPARTIE